MWVWQSTIIARLRPTPRRWQLAPARWYPVQGPRQLDPRGARVPDLPPDIRQLRLPMRDNPLRFVNSYVLKGDDGYVLVDCGFEGDDVLAALQAGLREQGIGLDDVRILVVTHYHAD